MKKYFIETDGGKQGPYYKYELKDIGIEAGALLSSDDEEGVYKAKDYPELLHILEKNPKKKIDYNKDRVFGFRLADDGDRINMSFKSRYMMHPLPYAFGIIFVIIML